MVVHGGGGYTNKISIRDILFVFYTARFEIEIWIPTTGITPNSMFDSYQRKTPFGLFVGKQRKSRKSFLEEIQESIVWILFILTWEIIVYRFQWR